MPVPREASGWIQHRPEVPLSYTIWLIEVVATGGMTSSTSTVSAAARMTLVPAVKLAPAAGEIEAYPEAPESYRMVPIVVLIRTTVEGAEATDPAADQAPDALTSDTVVSKGAARAAAGGASGWVKPIGYSTPSELTFRCLLESAT